MVVSLLAFDGKFIVLFSSIDDYSVFALCHRASRVTTGSLASPESLVREVKLAVPDFQVIRVALGQR